MTRVECPWCDRIFPHYEGHDILLLLGDWTLICDTCHQMMEENSGDIKEIDQEHWT